MQHGRVSKAALPAPQQVAAKLQQVAAKLQQVAAKLTAKLSALPAPQQVAEGLLGVAAAAAAQHAAQQPEVTTALRAPRIAFSLFLQLDNEAADEALCAQVRVVFW